MGLGLRLRRVTARALIAAPRERVWMRLHREPAAHLSLAVGAGTGRVGNPSGVVRRRPGLGWRPVEQVVAYMPPYRYGYRRVGGRLFRTYTGQILLAEYNRAATEVTWVIEFQAALPGTGWLAYAVLERLIDATLLRLKRELEIAPLS